MTEMAVKSPSEYKNVYRCAPKLVVSELVPVDVLPCANIKSNVANFRMMT